MSFVNIFLTFKIWKIFFCSNFREISVNNLLCIVETKFHNVKQKIVKILDFLAFY